jgi:hypothetical protein
MMANAKKGLKRNKWPHTCQWEPNRKVTHPPPWQNTSLLRLPLPTLQTYRTSRRRLRARLQLQSKYTYLSAVTAHCSQEMDFLMETFNRPQGHTGAFPTYLRPEPRQPYEFDFIGPCPPTHEYYIDKWDRPWANYTQLYQSVGGSSEINRALRAGISLDEILKPHQNIPDPRIPPLPRYLTAHQDGGIQSIDFFPAPLGAIVTAKINTDEGVIRSRRAFRPLNANRPKHPYMSAPPPTPSVASTPPSSPELADALSPSFGDDLWDHLGIDDEG